MPTPSPFPLKETPDLDPNSTTTQTHTMQIWLFPTSPSHRLNTVLPSLHYLTLARGLATLRQRINDLASLELKLYHKYLKLLREEELSVQAVMYAGCPGYAPLEQTWEQLERAELEKLLRRDVVVYDRLAEKVGKWKREIDGRIWR